MPRLYRPMKRAEDGLPVVGTGSKELGVRLPPNINADVDLDDDAVRLNNRGMSVAADWRYLKPHLIPKRLKPHVYGASGSNSLSIYRFGDGPFEASVINDHLTLVMKTGSTQHGNVVPGSAMPDTEFLARLAETRQEWTVEEPD